METIAIGSDDSSVQFTREEIFVMIKDRLEAGLSELILYLEERISEKTGRPFQVREDMKASLSSLFAKMRTRWQLAKRTKDPFFTTNKEWLNSPVLFLAPGRPADSDLPSTSERTDRPSKDFDELSIESNNKRKRSEEVPETLEAKEFPFATQISLRSVTRSPSGTLKYRRTTKSISEKTLSAEAALSIYIEYKYSKSQYQGLTMTSKENNCKLYPSYKKLAEAKGRCYPPNTAITITENIAEVQLQALLDHTADRILLFQEDVISRLDQANISHMQLIFKWGCDENSGQNQYKRTLEGDRKDRNVIFTSASVVPLQLITRDPESKSEIVIWKNPRPSSPRFCRPLRLQFLHENAESTASNVRHIEEQIKSLVPFENVMHGREISVTYKMAFAMIDGKVCNAVAFTESPERCNLCASTSKDFNDIDAMLQKEIDEENLKFGLSTLHVWIRFFECCLHLSYKLGIKKFQELSTEEKEIVEMRKKIIQKGFKSKLGLIVDRSTPGYGSANDGNSARRFFENSKTSATITGLDADLIERFHVVLQIISSGHEINNDKFTNYTLETARKFVELYPWYRMPTSVHKLLIHSPQIIAHALLPIGQLSAEAQKVRNKDVKRYRQEFSKKCPRVQTMEDVLYRLLLNSDPYISCVRKLPQKKLKTFSKEAIELLISPSIPTSPALSSLSEISSDMDSDFELYDSDIDLE